MMILTEGNLEITINNEINARKFDGPNHGLSHCMRAVDFVVEFSDRYLFVEVKDPQDPYAPATTAGNYAQRLLSGRITDELMNKYRDSLLYEWASGRADKPVDYSVLIGLSQLTDPDLLVVSKMLQRSVPALGPNSQPWPRPIVRNCAVFNIDSWNRTFPYHPVRRLP